MSYFNSISQNVISDTNNSSNVNVVGLATFTGLGTSTLGVNGIQVSLKTDQNCKVYVEQSPDNDPNHWDISDTFNYYAAIGNFGITVQAINSYTRVRVTNLSATTTTYFRLQTCLCPIVEAVPRATDDEGNLKTCIYCIHDPDLSSNVQVGPQNILRVSEHTKLAGAAFVGTTFDTNFWVKTVASGTGDATVAEGALTLSTGVTSNSSTMINSVRTARYIGACSNFWRGVVTVPAAIGANVRRWGCFDANDGYYFMYDNNSSTLSVNRRRAGVATSVTSGSFNGRLGSTYILDAVTHSYEIHWNNKSAWFLIDNILLHKISSVSNSLIATPSIKIGYDCTNTGGNTNNNSLVVLSGTINRIGKMEHENIYFNMTGAITKTLKYGPGKLCRIINNSGAGTSATIYDNTSALTPIIGTLSLNTSPMNVDYGVAFFNGLTIVTVGSSANITVVYE
jgi:hypothetical protein